jgi:DNA polymerase III subunit gamma/tau
MVFYRKYRPQKIDDLDNEKIRETLYTIFSSQDYPHAFLFSGPKGLGKTSTARIIAKVVNCENRKTSKAANPHKETIEPCNKCNQCISITNGTNIDVLEIDGASNRGIDEIRDLREKIRLSPAAARKKIYIIDEVHMLTTEAFNALLKTLEEPPAHALFILCTTESHKVLQTIASRCFQINFQKATKDELTRAFERIAHAEKIKIDKEALELIASLADGSFRDGVKVLEEILSLSKGEKITREVVEKKHSVVNINQQVSELIKSFEKKEVKNGLKLIGKIVDNGGDFKYFAQAVIEKLHTLLLGKVGVGESIEETAFSIDELRELIEVFNKAYLDTKYSVIVQLPFEIALINWSQKKAVVRDAEEVKIVDVSTASTQKVEVKKAEPEKVVEKKVESREPVAEHKQPKLLDKNDAFWNEVIEKMKSHNHTLAGVLRGAHLQSIENGEIVVETGFNFHKEKLTESKTLRVLEEVCSQIAGKNMSVSVILKEKGR